MAEGDLLRGLILQAEQLVRENNWSSKAIELNTRILELDDRVSGAYTRLAKCFREQGKYEAAREMYRQVLTFDPTNRIAGNSLIELEKWVLAKGQAEMISSLESYEEAFTVGCSASRRGKHALARMALLKAVELWPGSIHAWNALGAVYRRIGAPELGRQSYQAALNLKPNSASLVGLAAIARDQGDLDRAQRLYGEVLRAEPRNQYALKGLGGVLADLGLLDEADRYFELAATISKSEAGS